MGWLIALGALQLVVLVYIAVRIEGLPNWKQLGVATDLILNQLKRERSE